MRSDLVRSNDRRSRECSNGDPPCQYAPSPDADNPLGLCDGHLSEHRARCGIVEPEPCPACNPVGVLVDGRLTFLVGAMCFTCDRTTGGTVPSAQHRHEARRDMRARLLALFRTGDRGAEWAALLARCPAEMREAFARRLTVTPAETAAK